MKMEKKMQGMLVILGLLQVGPFCFAGGKNVGQLGMVEGEVFVDSKLVKKSAKVNEGSIIEVKDGKATLLLGKGSVFHLAADSKMVVNEFGGKLVADGSANGAMVESGELDLKFGRTRALILNKGGERKELKIKARAATMGVRGTEIFIDAPKDSQRPIQFFTLEGKAEVRAHGAAPPVTVNQNQGVATSGSAPTAGAATSSGSGTTAPTMTVSDVKTEIKNSGMGGVAPSAPSAPAGPGGAPPRAGGSSGLSDSFGVNSLPPIVLDPIQDRNAPLSITPKFCNASTGTCP